MITRAEFETTLKLNKEFLDKSKEIVKRYRDDEAATSSVKKPKSFNIFFSNVQVLQAAIYARLPQPVADRRFKDSDQATKDACQIIERGIKFNMEAYGFDETMKACRDDRLIIGRGTSWVRYEPIFRTENGIDELENPTSFEVVDFEKVCCEYVGWDDFLHSRSKRWEDVEWVARRTYLSKKQIEEKFDLKKKIKELEFKAVPITCDATDASQVDEGIKKAEIWEIWHKVDNMVYYASPDYKPFILKESEPPLNLKEFFPCPKPLYAALTTDSLIPIPDYCVYQDQAVELNQITRRISHLTEAIKVVGVRDASAAALDALLGTSIENTLIPVENWAMMKSDGGLKGVVEFFPIREVADVLKILYEVAASLKAEIYEICGISDIIRGNSSPTETATAQQIKGQYANLRLEKVRAEMARFARDNIALMAEVISEQFDPENLAQMTGSEFIDGDPERFMGAFQLLRNDKLRTFKIDIETDSTIALDEKAEQEAAGEYINATATFLEKFLPFASQFPSFAPVMGEMMMLGARKYRAGRGLEGALESAVKQFTEQLNAPQESQPDPAMKELELKAQNNQAMLEQQERKIQGELQLRDKIEQGKLNQIYERSAAEIELERAKQEREFAINIAKMEAENKRKTLQEARHTF